MEGKGRRCWLGEVLESHTNHLEARMIWSKVFGGASILEGSGWWFVVVINHFSKHSFRQVANILLILVFKYSWYKIASAARNWINCVPQVAATTFAFSSIFVLLLWCPPMTHVWGSYPGGHSHPPPACPRLTPPYTPPLYYPLHSIPPLWPRCVRGARVLSGWTPSPATCPRPTARPPAPYAPSTAWNVR